jgi:hypothetical protein
MTTTTHPTSTFALPHWSLRTIALIVASLAVVAAVLTVVLTQFVGSSGGHATTPGVYRIQHPGVAGQNAVDQCIYATGQLPRAC